MDHHRPPAYPGTLHNDHPAPLNSPYAAYHNQLNQQQQQHTHTSRSNRPQIAPSPVPVPHPHPHQRNSSSSVNHSTSSSNSNGHPSSSSSTPIQNQNPSCSLAKLTQLAHGIERCQSIPPQLNLNTHHQGDMRQVAEYSKYYNSYTQQFALQQQMSQHPPRSASAAPTPPQVPSSQQRSHHSSTTPNPPPTSSSKSKSSKSAANNSSQNQNSSTSNSNNLMAANASQLMQHYNPYSAAQIQTAWGFPPGAMQMMHPTNGTGNGQQSPYQDPRASYQYYSGFMPQQIRR